MRVFDEAAAAASGQVFVPAEVCRVKLEGAGLVDQRRLAVVGIRDPYTIGLIDKALDWAARSWSSATGRSAGRTRSSITRTAAAP